MPKRVISSMLALLYLSVSLFFTGGHGHDHDESHGTEHKCVACAWHKESTADRTGEPVQIPVPVVFVAVIASAELPISSSITRVELDRGPPFLS